ncbi:serine protein kinase RIO [Methanobrevibacter curvatus]|uniref:non-specific serine/threonine protein kinase n=1 Tax=Methanobrevibacter curvatus TaxID=49547 RepID=A0A166CFH5_9EURY|nr:serine protein kinase RIO [Methanobrevibacter curvatus]KZX13847.1 RIO1 family protein [Methanobrevibacter curvatus]
MDDKITKADKAMGKLESQKRFKGDEDRRVGSEIFDKSTLETLYKLGKQGYLDLLNGAISTGKEANVLKGLDDDGSFIAVKIYRITTSDFKKMQYYIQGDPRFKISSNNKRQLVHAWVNKEFRNLKRLYEAKVNVPKPIAALNNVLLIEFIGDEDGDPAQPTKNKAPLNPEDFFQKLLFEWKNFIFQGKLIHGDLSTYNILNYKEYPVIIDVSQAVVLDHIIAPELLKRDITNLTKEFKHLGLDIDEDYVKDAINFKEVFKK